MQRRYVPSGTGQEGPTTSGPSACGGSHGVAGVQEGIYAEGQGFLQPVVPSSAVESAEKGYTYIRTLISGC